MKSANTAKTALIVIDIQDGFFHPTHWGPSRSTPDFEKNVALLLKAAREHNKKQGEGTGETSNTVVICHVHHHSTEPNSPLRPGAQVEVNGKLVEGLQPQSFVQPQQGEPLFIKNVHSSFVGTGLEAYLKERGVRQLVLLGLTTDHCVNTTTRFANNLGVVSATDPNGEIDEGDIVVASDACATFSRGEFDAETVHAVHLASLKGEFAQVEETQDILHIIFG
ncbi:Isochorismatase hydrolase [Annulohypoxylon maeteangense]|uniref:Isochorismatase hydrolase n=1 Tax=Annulohypoxylon maeteangense TaxID=1927788 RepID=UPI002007C92F|nr:Isochorismatase hydrolase [Annulohypoxylon maeteangense]KAI0880573.1 Isochorismatase hydrolase [Annulohypoxylon maeteangense]